MGNLKFIIKIMLMIPQPYNLNELLAMMASVHKTNGLDSQGVWPVTENFSHFCSWRYFQRNFQSNTQVTKKRRNLIFLRLSCFIEIKYRDMNSCCAWWQMIYIHGNRLASVAAEDTLPGFSVCCFTVTHFQLFSPFVLLWNSLNDTTFDSLLMHSSAVLKYPASFCFFSFLSFMTTWRAGIKPHMWSPTLYTLLLK